MKVKAGLFFLWVMVVGSGLFAEALHAHPGPHANGALRKAEAAYVLAHADGSEPAGAEATSGEGDWRFRLLTEYRLPEAAREQIEAAHGGFAVDPRTHRLYFGLKGIGIIELDPQSGETAIIDDFPALKAGNLHNTTLFYRQGRPFLALPDNERGRVLVLDLEENELTTLNRPAVNSYYRDDGAFHPTDTEFTDSGLFVADGYSPGNFILLADPFAGEWLPEVFGGKGTDHGRFGTCHGVTYHEGDDRLDIADRPHSRIERYSRAGEYIESTTLPEGSWPCDVDFYDGHGVVGCLYGPERSTPAPIYILDPEGTVISTIHPKRDLGLEKARHIHNASWWVVPQGDGERPRVLMAVTAWNPGDFFILERVQ